MDQVILEATQFINTNVQYAPYIIFGLLILAGFNIPVSEDLMLFTSAVLASKNPELVTELFVGVFLGAYLSDLICYSIMGRFLGRKIFNIKFFANIISEERLLKISQFYERYGVATLIFGRFIPFGVRNALFVTAGISKMNALKFSLSDLFACLVSCSFFFYIYFYFGEKVIDTVKKGNIILFSLFIIVAGVFYIKNKRSTKNP